MHNFPFALRCWQKSCSHSVNLKHITRRYRLCSLNSYEFREQGGDNKYNQDNEALLKIGKSTRIILADLKNFCGGQSSEEIRTLPTNRIAQCMTLTVQNGPADVLFQLHGRQKYRCAQSLLRRLMPLCYSVCYDNLSCNVFPLGDPHQQLINSIRADVELKVKWVLRGSHHPPFFLYQPPEYLVSAGSSEKEVLLEAYCYYRFDARSGRLVSHIIDWVAAVPPVDLQLELELAQPWLGDTRRIPGSTASARGGRSVDATAIVQELNHGS